MQTITNYNIINCHIIQSADGKTRQLHRGHHDKGRKSPDQEVAQKIVEQAAADYNAAVKQVSELSKSLDEVAGKIDPLDYKDANKLKEMRIRDAMIAASARAERLWARCVFLNERKRTRFF